MLHFPRLTLASQSPRRKYLLTEAGFSFQTLHVEVNEDYPAVLEAHQIAGFLAQKKSSQVAWQDDFNILVTADTIVSLDGLILHKPKDAEEANKTLTQLSGKTHDVYTGVCIRNAHTQHVFTEKTRVTFKYLKPDFIEMYINQCAPFDKAGAYGVQDLMGYLGVKSIEGCFYNVMGFPVSAFYDHLSWFVNKQGL